MGGQVGCCGSGVLDYVLKFSLRKKGGGGGGGTLFENRRGAIGQAVGNQNARKAEQ